MNRARRSATREELHRVTGLEHVLPECTIRLHWGLAIRAKPAASKCVS